MKFGSTLSVGITHFVNIGLSGGGQHAIATGLDARSLGVVTVGSLAPYAELGQDFYKELSERDLLAQSKSSYKTLVDSNLFTMHQGWDWVADDYSSYLQPWGFDPRDVQVPVIIWQGGLDLNVPVVHGEWLSRNIPHSRYELRPEESHIGLFVNYEDGIIESALELLK